jgi:hypothetical protein
VPEFHAADGNNDLTVANGLECSPYKRGFADANRTAYDNDSVRSDQGLLERGHDGNRLRSNENVATSREGSEGALVQAKTGLIHIGPIRRIKAVQGVRHSSSASLEPKKPNFIELGHKMARNPA